VLDGGEEVDTFVAEAVNTVERAVETPLAGAEEGVLEEGALDEGVLEDGAATEVLPALIYKTINGSLSQNRNLQA
jgi:hypothetical protein